ncbi:uncharacterized protein DUF3570 [Permianibacter aggregans]|uniref:Uncharacterized protein DUF3570 n=1 Tax=Permianibacter aggregans TaxID=1510150 RepID=A0A4V3D857_9GAMM|nr:uncharacterized protein DUF3570 [Permianibacter aggregans]
MLAEQKEAVAVAVAATKPFLRIIGATLISVAFAFSSHAGVLPEERADLLAHSYQGGGMDISGPSLLVRKNFLEKVSVSANYYIDNVSSASIDVLTSGASEYEEERKEYSFSADYLYNKTTFSTGYTSSEESDYSAETIFFGVSQDFFGDLSTISLGYAQGDDLVSRNEYTDGALVGNTIIGTVKRQNYRLSFSQVITTNLIMGLGFETVTDQANREDEDISVLNNPYRSVRFRSAQSGTGYATQREFYPDTRTSDAVALRAMYYLPWRASIRAEYRFFTDTWGIEASNYELKMIHPIEDLVTIEGKYRYYEQTASTFYRDLFDEPNELNFRARDKEMSTFNNTTFGLGATLNLGKLLKWNAAEHELMLNFFVDHMMFSYDDFRDLTVHTSNPGAFNAGEEPLYEFDAQVYRLFLTYKY